METRGERCLDAGMQDYISKPVSKSRLEQVVSDWITANNSKDASNVFNIRRPDIHLGDAAGTADASQPESSTKEQSTF